MIYPPLLDRQDYSYILAYTELKMAMKKDVKLNGTDLIHGDHGVHYSKGAGAPVAAPISVSTSEFLDDDLAFC